MMANVCFNKTHVQSICDISSCTIAVDIDDAHLPCDSVGSRCRIDNKHSIYKAQYVGKYNSFICLLLSLSVG